MSRDAALAVALRRCQWRCDDAAFAAGAGKLDAEQARELAEELRELAAVLRRFAASQPVLEIDHPADG